MNTPISTANKHGGIAHTAALALAGAMALMALASCNNDPIFASIEHEVKLKDPTIVGTVSSMVTVGGNLYAANGYIFCRTAGTGGWYKIGLPAGADRCAKIASDGTNLYGLFTETDWASFHSVQLYAGGTWTPVSGLSPINLIGSGAGRIYAFTENPGGANDHSYNAYATGSAGATSFSASPIAQNIGIPTGTAGDYFTTETACYRFNGSQATPISWDSLGYTPGGLCGVVIGSNGNVYTANFGNAYRWDGTAWTTRWLDLDNDPATGITILQTASKNLLIVGCDEGYGEISLNAATGELGSYMSPGSTSLSSTDQSDEDQYDSSINLYNLSGVFAVTSPVPAGDEYVLYASVSHYKYNGLWSYYDTTQTEWNRE